MSDTSRVFDAALDSSGSESSSPEASSEATQALVPLKDQPPEVLPAIVLDDLVPFPGTVVPVLLETQSRRDAVLHARSNQGFFALLNRALSSSGEHPSDRGDVAASAAIAGAMMGGEAAEVSDDHLGSDREEPTDPPPSPAPRTLSELAPVGIAARVIRVFQLPDQRMSALVELLRRLQPVELLRVEPFPAVRVLYPTEHIEDGDELEALYRQVRITLRQFMDAHPALPDELRMAAMAIRSPGMLSDFVAQHLSRGTRERLEFLSELNVVARTRRALEVTIRELDLLTVGNRISDEIRTKVEKTQREFFLREQLKAIRAELGEEKDPAALAVEELEARMKEAGLPEIARERAEEELRRLQLVPPESPEHNVVRSYLDWIVSLPWSKLTEDHNDVRHARKVLDEDHYGLEEVKDRIVEYLAVRQLNPEATGTLLCFAGPPGVGKTSLGQSIARALGREFYRFSVGGMRDEAEIKGHRRTYIGAMPGRILQALKQVGVRNPVIMLDELDKMGSDWRGDPSSAMLEVLDPAQNRHFLDHYLDLPFDLSRVMFIATANVKSEIPAPLLDRLEVIDLPGYIPEEKVEIAANYLVRRQRKEHGLTARQLRVGKPVIRQIVRQYTHEAGVRELNRVIGKLCRKRATQVVEEESFDATVKVSDLPTLLGPPKIHEDELAKAGKPGVAVGLAWTPVGGEVLTIESVGMMGKGVVKTTGQLGDVMSESANLAISYVRHRANELGVDPTWFDKHDLHIHFPAGAVKKDGPSAGITITTALISLLTGRAVNPRLAMTGEMTLRGEVLPVGGIREKVVAARRMGIKTVILPERNHADVEEIPEEVRKGLRFVYASTYEDVRAAAFPKAAQGPSKRAAGNGASQGKRVAPNARGDGRNNESAAGRRAGGRAAAQTKKSSRAGVTKSSRSKAVRRGS